MKRPAITQLLHYRIAQLFLLLLICLSPFIPATGYTTQFVTLVSIPSATVAAGKPAVASLRFRVGSGFHINSNHPNSDLLIPTRLKLNPPTDLGVGNVTYPPGKDISFSFSPQEKLNVYTGDFKVDAVLSAVHNATPGHYRLHGELAFQACDDRSCYPPQKLPVSIDVTVLKSRVPGQRHPNPRQSPHIHN